MRPYLMIVMTGLYIGCGTLAPKEHPPIDRRLDKKSFTKLPFNQKETTDSDVKVIQNFLDALTRPRLSTHKIIVDASADTSQDKLLVNQLNGELAWRLAILRRTPDKFEVVLHSADNPNPYGSGLVLYTYSKSNGMLIRVGPHQPGKNISAMWIDIRHWPNGTRLVNVDWAIFDDFKTNNFQLRSGETIFRFAWATEPIE